MKALPAHVDVLIVGAGPAGSLLAQNLANSHYSVLVAEARTEPAQDARVLALSYASQQKLQAAKLWDDSLSATPIQRVHVSQHDSLGRLELDADEIGLPELGYVISYAQLQQLAHQRLQQSRVHYAPGLKVAALNPLNQYVRVGVDGQQLTTRLVVLADGGPLANQLPGFKLFQKSYQQDALLARLRPQSAHLNRAWERFSSQGPLALLPHGDELALVWALPVALAEQKQQLSDADFLAELNQAIGGRAPQLIAVAERHRFPLVLKMRDRIAENRVVMIGNAAQTLHPIAGQGLNLGLRDAEILAQLLLNSRADELGSPEQLKRFMRLRKTDSIGVGLFTDALVELFLPQQAALLHARSLGLLALDACAPARREVARKLVFGLN